MTKSHPSQLTLCIGVSAALACLLLAGCSKQPEPQKEAAAERGAAPPPPAESAKPPEAPKPPEEAKKEEAKKEETARKEAEPAKTLNKVKFSTTKGDFVVQLHPEWAPKGTERFIKLVQDHYFDGARFFRVLPGFVVQFGLAGDPAKTHKWDTKITDDPVMQTNKPGTLVYATAGPNTRTTQLFINLGRNQSLDGQGFAPFGEVLDDGMSVVRQINAEYGEQPDQGEITMRGNTYLTAQFPKLDYVKTARLTE